MILGVIAALIKDLMDTRVRQDSDIAAITDAPVLGSLTRNDSFGESTPVIIAHPASREAEEVRRLRTNLSFVLPDEHLAMLLS